MHGYIRPGVPVLASFFILALAAIPLTAQQTEPSDSIPSGSEKKRTPVPDPGAQATTAPTVEDRINALNIRQRVAQLMLVTLEGAPSPNMSDREFLTRYMPGGVVISSALKPVTAAEYITKLRAMPIDAVTGIPMLIGTDFFNLPKRTNERQPIMFTAMPSLLAVAAANDPDVTLRLSEMVAAHLKIMGFNFHLGPPLELAPALPDIKGSIDNLGSSPQFVAESGCAILSTLERNGVIGLPMGFPGGGANRRGSDPAVLLTPRPQLEEQDLLPYVKAIEQGTSIIHVGNSLVPTIDPVNRPASLSPAVIQDLLRKKLGFKGVIVVGPLDAPEIEQKYDSADAAIMALEAGADMLYWEQAGRKVMRAADIIAQAVVSRRISQQAVDSALTRIIHLKDEKKLRAHPMPKVKDAESLSKKRVYPKEAYDIERRSITLVQNRNNTLPLNKAASLPVGVTGVAGVETLANALEDSFKFVPRQRITTARHAGDIMDFEINRIVKRVMGLKTMVLVLTPELRMRGQIQLLTQLQAQGIRVVVVLIGYPESLPKLADADAIVLSYSNPVQTDISMKAVADVLVGQAPISVRPLARELRTTAGKPEVFNVLDIIRAPSGLLPVTIAPPFVAGLSVPYDPTFSLKRVEWDFGDGKRSKEFRVERAYQSPGRYPITLTVSDKKNHSTSRTFHAIVE